MISPARHSALHATPASVSPRWLASVLVAASLLELAILRIGTRTAIHIPGLEELAGPYELVAAVGRLSFYVAVVLLIVLLPYLAVDLHRRGRTHAAVFLFTFIVVAGLGGLRLVGNVVMAPAIATIVVSLAGLALVRQRGPLRAILGLFFLAFLAAALPAIVQSSSTDGLAGGSRNMMLAAELLAVLAAIGSGPLVRRALGLAWFPPSRLTVAGVAAGLVVTGMILANPSTAHILMLWNFGLTGALPAAVYGLAAASFVVAVASSARCGQQTLALVLTLVFLGGIGLTSTYQSGLMVAGLGLLDLAVIAPKTPRSEPMRVAFS